MNGVLTNPYVLLIVIVLIVALVLTGALMLLFAPNIMAALLIALLAVWILIKAPIPDLRFKIGLPILLVFVAIMVYYYGNELLAVVV